MRKLVLGLAVVTGILGTTAVTANAAATTTGTSTGDVTFTAGDLSMSVDTVNLSFGSNAITSAATTLDAGTAPTIKVSDLRGTNAGWNLTVAQDAQFSSGTDELANGSLTVAGKESDSNVTGKSATLVPGSTAGEVANATTGHGSGDSTVTFADSKLAVPGASGELATKYTLTLTWNLGATPSNS